MASNVATTLIIDFGNTDAGSIQASLDSKKNGGRATFQAGDAIYFKVYSQVPYTVEATAGTVTKGAKDTENITDEFVTFARSCLGNSAQFIKTLGSYTWLGKNCGVIEATGYNNLVIKNSATETPIGVAKVSYSSEYDSWCLNAPNFTEEKYVIVLAIIAT